MAENLVLRLFGNPELQLAGQPLARLRSAKAYALLYYLAVTRQAQPRTHLAGLLWGDMGDYYARRNLNRTLSNLTQLVGDHLVIDRQSLAFARHEPYWLDVEELENAAISLPTAQTVATLAVAADLYRGDFLAGFYVQDAPQFEQWVLNERTRLRTAALQLHQTLAHFYAQQGELALAMDYTRRLLQLEPWHETAHRQLMLWLAQSGQRSAALAQYELCRQALRDELDVEPDAATLELVAQIRAGSFDKMTGGQDDKMSWGEADLAHSAGHLATTNALRAASSGDPVILSPGHPVTLSSSHPIIRNNLPPQRTPFIGRAQELGDITRLLVEEVDCRLLTVVGPGGMGKTRLALKAAEQIMENAAQQPCFGDGIFFVPLENVSDERGLAAAMIAAITEESNLRAPVDGPLQAQLVHFLRTKWLLLVLDNFEQLTKHAELCADLLLAAPSVKLLVTSRETLGLQEAWIYPLLGLTLPNSLPQGKVPQGDYDAVRLFAQCARRTNPAFDLDAERATVLRICTLVEGMPLGIELAAAWLKVMPCAQIAAEVARNLDFLTARYQNIPARHRSMRAVLAHSWALLAPDETTAIARLAIFRGQFSQAAATAITGTSLFTLATLVEKALVRVTPAGYYQLHELTRQYAEEQLPSDAIPALRDVHTIYYARLLGAQNTHLFTATYREVWQSIGGELDNICHAWSWLINAVGGGRQGLPVAQLLRQMANVFAQYYIFQSLLLAGQALFVNACQVLEGAGWAISTDQPYDPQSLAATLLHLQILTGLFHFELGHYRTSLTVAEQALAPCRESGLAADLLMTLLLYGRTQMRRGTPVEATAALQEALTLGQQIGSAASCAEALLSLGLVASSGGDYAQAQTYLRQGLALCQEIGYRPWVARTLTNLGTTYSRQRDYQQALPYYEQALAIAKEEGDQNIVMINTSNLGGLYQGIGQYGLSIDYYQRSLTMARQQGDVRWIAANLNGLAITYLAQGELPSAEPALREALTVGQQSDSTPDTLGSIGLLGHLFARRGQLAQALNALTFVEGHPATMARDHLYNAPLLAELRSELDQAHLTVATAWAGAQTLDTVVRWLLHGENSFPITP